MAGKPMLIAIREIILSKHRTQYFAHVTQSMMALLEEIAWFMKERVTVYATRNSRMRIIKQILITCFW